MKTKILGVVAACVLALSVGTANASTIAINGAFDSFVGTINPMLGSPPSSIDMTSFPLPAYVNGTLTFDGGVLSALQLNVRPAGSFNALSVGTIRPDGTVFVGYTTSGTFSDAQNWSFTLNGFRPGVGFGDWVYQIDLTLTDTAGILAASMYQVAQPGCCGFDSYVGNFTDWHGTASEVPLPGALPLFATGLGALGLLGWRRRRKAV
jgi:hypothetical protein